MPNVADIEVGATDNLGQIVKTLYGRKARQYCVYGVKNRVMICFADESEGDLSNQQRKQMSELAPLRGEIDGLIDGWRSGVDRSLFGTIHSGKIFAKANNYNRRVADALVVGLENDTAGASALLTRIRQDILDERIARARFEYLIAALLTALGLMFLAWLVTSTYPASVSGEPPATVDARVWIGRGVLLLALVAAGAVFYVRWSRLGFEPHDDRKVTQPNSVPPIPQREDEDPVVQPGPSSQRTRFVGSFWPAIFVFAAIAIPTVMMLWGGTGDDPTTYLKDYAPAVIIWRAAAAGTVGAFFSIAIGIRGRTVLPDLLRSANLLDAALRVTIGFIGASVLMALLALKLVIISLGGGAPIDGSSILGVLVVGFLAGFSERLVPDLLEKVSATGAPAPTPTPRPAPAPSPSPSPTPTPSGGAAGEEAKPEDDPGSDSHEDGCASDHEPDDDQVTDDRDLPPASGGVAGADEETKS